MFLAVTRRPLRTIAAAPLLGLLLVTGCAHRAQLDMVGPRQSRMDLYRAWPGGDKLYVEVDLGDGEPRMMLLDTGAGITLITPEVAQELGLVLSPQVDQYMQVSGILEARSAVIPEVRIGRHTLRNVKVAVPLAPVHDQAGGVTTAGLLGNNVLSWFQVVVDYPGNELTLARSGTVELPQTAAPLYFDGQHAMTGVVVVGRKGEATVEEQVLVDIDTGARGLWLFGGLSERMAELASEGLEPVVGVSSAEGLPLRAMLQVTRRIPVVQVHAGGAVVEREIDATWTSFGEETTALASSTPGLLGHSVLDGYRAVLDYPAQRFALLPPGDASPEHDIHQWRLRTLKRSRDPDRLVRMAELRVWMDDVEGAARDLERHHRQHPEDPEGAVLLARIWRNRGHAEEARQLLAGVAPAELAEHGELVAQVNALWLAGGPQEALALAEAAVAVSPDSSEAWVALADARQRVGQLAEARSALVEANTLDENPDGNLLRRAWLALEEGDQLAALTHLRRHLELYPAASVTPWFYGLIVDEDEQRALLADDLDRAVSRLHPGEGALDFIAAGYQRAGRDERAVVLATAGRERDCAGIEEPPQLANCLAWYDGVMGQNLDEAEARVRAALVVHPRRPEYLDTLAVILEARGDLAGARDASWAAAAQSPDDVYLLWQAARLQAAVDGVSS